MKTLEKFMDNLIGEFNNEQQIERELNQGKQIHPKAVHINSICNDKVENLPKNFEGYFMIEESYYEMGERKNSLPHLFLFKLNKTGNVVLTSYEIPEGITKEELKNSNQQLKMNYTNLILSPKFNPMIYTEDEGIFEGESISDFGNGIKFTLKEKITQESLEVSEVFEKNGKMTFGFKEPIIYKKMK